jgi:archaemetzincin
VVNIGRVEPGVLEEARGCVEALFHCDVSSRAPLPVPPDALDVRRQQHSSVAFMLAMARESTSDADRVIGITEYDLFIPMLTFVFGQAQLRGRLALVSMARLRQEFYGAAPDPELLRLRMLKEVGHELGHSVGLIHCADRECLMSLATSIQDVDRKGLDFCRSCREFVDSATEAIREKV